MPYTTDMYVRRDDFERRMLELSDRIIRVEVSAEKRIDQITMKIDQLQTMIGALQSSIDHNTTSKWQWIAGTSISFFMGGGGLYGLLALTHAIK